MSNEVFRFVSLRPPQVTDSEENRVTIYRQDNPSRFYEDLRAIKATGQPRAAFERRAQQYFDSGEYALGGEALPVAMDRFAEWLSGQGSLVSVDALLEQVVEQLGASLSDLLGSDEFQQTRMRVADSTVATAILPNARRESRAALLRVMRIVDLLEKLPGWSTGQVNVGRVMTAILLLPNDIFPLPPAENPHDARIKAEAEQVRRRHEEAQQHIKDLAHKLTQLQSATREVALAYGADTNDSRRTYTSRDVNIRSAASAPRNRGDVVLPDGAPAAMAAVLTPERAAALSGPTKNLLDVLSISTEFVDVRHTSTALEQEIGAIAERLYNGRSFTTLVRIGDVFVPADTFTAESIDGSDKVPGACMQALPESPVVTEPTLPATQASSLRPVGIADLLQVRQQIKRYVPGEIAHIENILLGENKSRTHRQSTRIVETRLVETETTKEDSRDSRPLNGSSFNRRRTPSSAKSRPAKWASASPSPTARSPRAPRT